MLGQLKSSRAASEQRRSCLDDDGRLLPRLPSAAPARSALQLPCRSRRVAGRAGAFLVRGGGRALGRHLRGERPATGFRVYPRHAEALAPLGPHAGRGRHRGRAGAPRAVPGPALLAAQAPRLDGRAGAGGAQEGRMGTLEERMDLARLGAAITFAAKHWDIVTESVESTGRKDHRYTNFRRPDVRLLIRAARRGWCGGGAAWRRLRASQMAE